MNAQSARDRQGTVAQLVIQRVVLIALAMALILGLYPALLEAIAPAVP